MTWTIEQSRMLYHIGAWSEDYVDINADGQVTVTPSRNKSTKLELGDLTQQLQAQGLALPVLVRFSDILKERVTGLIDAFDNAIQAADYRNRYTAIYPIKVNQQRRVIEDIVAAGKENVGLEAGSKPEMLVVIAFAREGSTLICNGYKDREYIRLALIAGQLGFKAHIVIEKLSELALIVECVQSLKVKPLLGLRIRLSSMAKGKWQNSGGEKSKFGLHANQVIEAIEILKANDLLDSLKLLHFHIGSQVTELSDFRTGLNEGARYYAQFRKSGVEIETLDIGGGLGVDYEGTQSSRYCSVDYTVAAYANSVIETIQSICLKENIPAPSIITESGRAMTAHHAMLITNIIDVEQPVSHTSNPAEFADTAIIVTLYELLEACSATRVEDCYRQNQALYKRARNDFAAGQLNLKQWAVVDELHYAINQKLLGLIHHNHPELLNKLRDRLADKYFCNFSLFQSMPDAWAIDQIFPIIPLQRLDEKPDKRCTIQDLTCDSDGRVDKYVDGEGVETSLPIHSLGADESYLIGVFMLGAYQEILGDIHNLFGDTASVNVDIDDAGNVQFNEIDTGDTVADLFQAIHVDPEKLKKQYAEMVKQEDLSSETQNAYLSNLIDGLSGYTYLENN